MVTHLRKRSLFRRLLTPAGLIASGLIVVGMIWTLHLPDVSLLAARNPETTAMIAHRERNGVFGKPIWVTLNDIAPPMRHAVIVAEDANFYRHRGVDWGAMWKAFQRNWKEKRMYRGGSTITQQLAKNLYLNPSKNLWRKFNEIAIAMRLERSLTKSRILELYLNIVEWGRGIYGVESAARHYFGKSAADLTIEEASRLAAMLPSPLRFERRPDSRYVQARSDRIARWVERRMGPAAVLIPAVNPPPLPAETEMTTPPEEPPVLPEEEVSQEVGQ
jgi:monofunctional biosynthetic peptidoglycan transglycosylase